MDSLNNQLPEGLLWKYLGVTSDGLPWLAFLDDCLFRTTPPKALNDPFEMKPCVLMDRYSDEDWEVAREKALHHHMFPTKPSDDIIEAFFLATIPRRRFDEKNFPSMYPARLPELREEPFHTVAEIDEFRANRLRETVEETVSGQLGVFSLTEDPENLLMWAHYGGMHRGLVVGFERRHAMWKTAGELRKVEYVDKRVSISSNNGFVRVGGQILAKGDLPPVGMLLRKHPDWAYEQEWRLIIPLDRAERRPQPLSGEQVFLFRVPNDAIKALALGVRVGGGVIEQVQQKIRADQRWHHLRLFEARLHERRFALEFQELEWKY